MTPIEPSPPPRKETFTEQPMPDEPRTDVELQMESGMMLRERVARIDSGAGVSLQFTYTRLDGSNGVALDARGEPMISPVHEITIGGENAARIDVDQAVLAGREIAAARAVDHFTGLEKLGALMADRLG